jgi:hypothetical protein
MIDMEVPVITALENDVDVSTLVGSKVFRWTVPGESANDYPYIRVAELNNTDNDYADNKPRSSDIPIQVDLWTKDDPSTLQDAIDKVMKSLKFERTGVTPFFEENTGAMRKAMRYNTKVKLEEEL